jgi:hypothetical protein
MSQGPEFIDSELLKDADSADSTNQRPALKVEGEDLKTTRFNGVLPVASGSGPLPSFPAPAEAEYALPAPAYPMPPPTLPREAPMHPSAAPAPAPSSQSAETTAPRARLHMPPNPPKPSWLRALLTTSPSDTERRANAGGLVSPHVAGAIFAALGLLFAGVALITGLRGAPTDWQLSPVVAAALVIARALVALGAGALSFAMLRQAERLLVRTPDPGN